MNTEPTAGAANVPHPRREHFQEWLKAFRPELQSMEIRTAYVLYTAAWCNGVAEERKFSEQSQNQCKPH